MREDDEKVRMIKQGVLADVSCVLARAGGADIDAEYAFTAARNICSILFAHPHAPSPEIPKLFWDTPLGRAVGVCCGTQLDEPRVKTTLRIPLSVRERLRLEAEALNKSLTDIISEKLAK
uniref:Uncharacterized protein n=1 Tax=uncultured Armatimonadetes bacterium TaxID=157466 RepID=A0A6J4JEG1_9BACT|nr:hypothetical protein AVDCRST_MAG63-3128 [uncultured Armatimonadetes bacterium]